MADPGASTSQGKLSSRFDKGSVKELQKKRNASRVCLYEAFERLRVFKDEHNLKSDKDVAEFLLNSYNVKNTLR